MKLRFFIALWTVANFACAQPRSVANAEKEAIAFVHLQDSVLRRRTYVKNRNFAEVIDDKSVYIFNDLVNECFVIVSKDERMKTILGYCDRTCFDTKQMPVALKELIDTYNEEYDYLQECGVIGDKQEMPLIPDVAPLLSTSWGQGFPYNNLCPKYCPSGCVATAMSQIMKYYNYPDKGNGYYSYVTATKRYNCSFDFSTSYDWKNMQNLYSSTSVSYSSNQAVAYLMYACGVSVGMDYSTDGSGAYAPDVPYAIINHFNYSPNAAYYARAYFRTDEWYEVLCKELKEKRPVLYCGSDYYEGGHAFVVDGCSSNTGKFHVNWGWDGNYDGYYELDALDPNHYQFSIHQSMIVRFSPESVGEHEDVFYMEKFIPKSRFELNRNVSFELCELYCYSSEASYTNKNAKFYGVLGLGLYDEEKRFVKSLSETSMNGYNVFYGEDLVTMNFVYDKSTFADDGVYYIAPYIIGRNSKIPTRVRTFGGETDYYPVTVKNGVVDDGSQPDDGGSGIAEWHQDFETGIPVSWRQEQIKGSGKWSLITPLTYSDKQPKPACGSSYVSMEYSSSGFFSVPATVTKLVSDQIELEKESTYEVSFSYRKFSSKTDSKVAMKVFMLKDYENWILMNEYDITNSKGWNTVSIRVTGKECMSIAIEGSVDYGSRIYIDNIKICKDNTNSIKSPIEVQCDEVSSKSYNLAGLPFVEKKDVQIIKGKKFLVR